MSAGPPLQLALLWPWLLMATLQAGLGRTGLALVAAVESERSAAQKAIIRVIPLKVEPIILEGEFANVAEVTPAEGKLLQSNACSSEGLWTFSYLSVFASSHALYPYCLKRRSNGGGNLVFLEKEHGNFNPSGKEADSAQCGRARLAVSHEPSTRDIGKRTEDSSHLQ
ncbi:e3 ubiquitin-protein ligase rnf43 [Limosa lapponica baueri]|uniref:E3 ubiquitin-protein ligase rnf43 n=1 Tax=Limosa lapponica baueri TaxID=1758121 RepID=A0A2I0TK39_LIMLA|nr:e3 ubiquitin-protein ligase rnf43 [Limosa lapponica baueri]